MVVRCRRSPTDWRLRSKSIRHYTRIHTHRRIHCRIRSYIYCIPYSIPLSKELVPVLASDPSSPRIHTDHPSQSIRNLLPKRSFFLHPNCYKTCCTVPRQNSIPLRYESVPVAWCSPVVQLVAHNLRIHRLPTCTLQPSRSHRHYRNLRRNHMISGRIQFPNNIPLHHIAVMEWEMASDPLLAAYIHPMTGHSSRSTCIPSQPHIDIRHQSSCNMTTSLANYQHSILEWVLEWVLAVESPMVGR